MSGVAEVRAPIAEAQERLALNGKRTVLFIDEIHRFNKAQQDALLPHVEDGTVTLIGATTENPYFEVNSALLSRMRVWRLEPLTDEEVASVVRRALADEERGLAGALGPRAEWRSPTTPSSISSRSRAATRAPRSTCSRARPRSPRPRTSATPTAASARRLEDVETAAQQRVLAYDRAGDGHYDTVSAFIKSLRGNDPDAALYWLAAMIAAGEDPRFVARRLIISASEDVGNADPRALRSPSRRPTRSTGSACPRRSTRSPRRRSSSLSRRSRTDRPGVRRGARRRLKHGSQPVPNHLRTAGDRRMKRHGIGVGYKFPHDFEGDDVDQQYLPDQLVGRRYYQPGDQGHEVVIAQRMADRQAARAERPRRKSRTDLPTASMSDAMRPSEANRKAMAETQKRDAAE